MTARKSLAELLDLIFGAEDLRRFVAAGLGTADAEAVGYALQWDRIQDHDRSSRVVEEMELQGRVGEDLFDRLLADFPERAPEIEQVARQWVPDRSSCLNRGRRRAPPISPGVPVEGSWDLFLAHAGPDGRFADQLYEVLAPEGLSVFLDSRCVGLGERWDDVIPAALVGARVVAVLISERTRDAHYAREEIALAIQAGRQTGSASRVVPVYLDRLPDHPADWLYGLQRLNGLVAADVGWPGGVAARLVALVEDREAADGSEHGVDASAAASGRKPAPDAQNSGRTPPTPTSPPTTGLHYLHLAMDLDRSEQWLALLKESRSDESGIFLLYGERRQNLELFMARLWHYLAEETDRHHRIIEVPVRREMELPRTGAAWEINLRRAIHSGQGTAADLLAEAARHRPVFLLLGEHPVSTDGLDEDEEAIAALEDFLEHRLPALLAGCPGPYPVRALLATDYESGEQSLEERLYRKIQGGARRQGVRFRRLPEVEHVQWSHIKGYLDSLDPPPPAAVYKALEGEYQRLDHGHISFRDLAERLSRKI